jgi:hypothetical protein
LLANTGTIQFVQCLPACLLSSGPNTPFGPQCRSPALEVSARQARLDHRNSIAAVLDKITPLRPPTRQYRKTDANPFSDFFALAVKFGISPITLITKFLE